MKTAELNSESRQDFINTSYHALATVGGSSILWKLAASCSMESISSTVKHLNFASILFLQKFYKHLKRAPPVGMCNLDKIASQTTIFSMSNLITR